MLGIGQGQFEGLDETLFPFVQGRLELRDEVLAACQWLMVRWLGVDGRSATVNNDRLVLPVDGSLVVSIPARCVATFGKA